MNRDRLTVLLLCVAAILAVAIVGMSLATARSREVAVAGLRLKGTALAKRIPALRPASGHEDILKPQTSEPSVVSTAQEETLASFKRLMEMKKTLKGISSWEELLGACRKYSGKWTESERRELTVILDANRNLVKELRHMADSGGHFFTLDYSKGPPMETQPLVQMREFARILIADAEISAGTGDFGSAVDDLIAEMQFTSVLEKEPTLISQVYSHEMNNTVSRTVEEAIQGERLPADQCERLIQLALHATNRQGYADSLAYEGISSLDTFEGIRSGEIHEYFADESVWSMRELMVRAYGTPFARPWLNADEAAYADIMGRIIDAARVPYYEAQSRIEQIDADVNDLPGTRVLSNYLLFWMHMAVFGEARCEIRMNMMGIGLAIEQYHAQNSSYPTSLDVVAATLGGTVPIDPLTGKPYVYEASSGGYTLYSTYTGPAPSFSWASRDGIPGADANGHISWRGPR